MRKACWGVQHGYDIAPYAFPHIACTASLSMNETIVVYDLEEYSGSCPKFGLFKF